MPLQDGRNELCLWKGLSGLDQRGRAAGPFSPVAMTLGATDICSFDAVKDLPARVIRQRNGRLLTACRNPEQKTERRADEGAVRKCCAFWHLDSHDPSRQGFITQADYSTFPVLCEMVCHLMPTADSLLILIPPFFGVAFLYSTVGHAGASGYIAVMALLGWSQDEIKPTALILNIAVAAIGSVQFWRAGHFSFRLFWPFALLSIPCAFLGGALSLPTRGFRVLVGITLLCSAVWFLIRPREATDPSPPRVAVALPVGGGIGLIAGITGTGGGIFLSPLVILMRWAGTRMAAATSALFILVNSLSGLLGHFSADRPFPRPALALVVAVVAGGSLGAYLGSRRFSPERIKRFLAVVLTIAGLKLMLTQ